MLKEEAIQNFVKSNFKLLNDSSQFDWKIFNSIKKSYFSENLKYHFGLPKDREICDYLIKLIIKIHHITKKEDLEMIIIDNPLLKMNNVKSCDYIVELENISKKYAIKEELANLSEIDRLDKMTEFITREKSKDIENQIKQKQEEYKKLPSIIDEEEFEEPSENIQKDETKEWWEELNLRENPFPGPLDGFSLLNTNIYKEIIVETAPIQWALNKINKDIMYLFHKGFLLGGEFGTGKTTFYDYLAPQLTLKHIESIRIAQSDNISVAHYMNKFERLYCIELNKIASKNYNVYKTERIMDFESARIVMLELQDLGVKGFLIFIDDLHKNVNQEYVFNFLANLQIIKNTFSRDKINACFIVAGFPKWRDRIKKDSALTGFFDGSDELCLPEVTPELAAQAIKKRLHAFSINPEKDIKIKEEYLKTIFKKVSSELGRGNIGFRPYIQEAINNFSTRKYDILSVNYTIIDKSLSNEIKEYLEMNVQFKNCINKLIYGGGIKKKENRENVLKVLCEIYLQNGIGEEDNIFKNNIFCFKQLAGNGFIIKHNREGKLIWKLPQFMYDLNKSIINTYNLSLEDYLVSIYSTSLNKAKDPNIGKDILSICENDLKEWKNILESHMYDLIKTSLILFKEYIYPYSDGKNIKLSNLNIYSEINNVKNCIWNLMKCILLFESPSLLLTGEEENIFCWKLRHNPLESSHQFISLYQNMNKYNYEANDYARLITFGQDAFYELWNEFKKCIKVSQSSMVKCCELPRFYLNVIYKDFDSLFAYKTLNDEYFIVISNFIGNIETLIRKYLLISCCLIFGPYHKRIKYYPENIKKYISKNIFDVIKNYEDYNEFENLNRGQYRNIFTEINRSSEFYKLIIFPIIKNWDSIDINSFFQMFGDINIITSHLKYKSIEQKKKEIPTFFRLSCRFISEISSRIINLIMRGNIIENNGNIIIVYGFNDNKKDENKKSIIPEYLYEYNISKMLETRKNVITQLSDNIFGNKEIDFLDYEGTRIEYSMNYCDVVSLITYLISKKEIEALLMYGASVSIKNTKI